MRKVTIIIGIMLMSLVNVVYGQTDEERAAVAKGILDKMSSKNKSYSTVVTKFTVTIDNKQDNSKKEFAGGLMIKGDKYQLDIMDMVTYYDGKISCTWLRKDQEASITDMSDADDSEMSPMKLIGSYDKGYKMRYIQDVKVGGALCAEVDLYPTERKGNITRVRLTIDKSSYTIKRIMQQGKDGVSYYVNIDSFVTNTAIADKEFVFDRAAHPEVEVVDMR